MTYLDSARRANEEQDPGHCAVDEQLHSEAPALTEYLTATVYPDGKPRQTSTLVIFTEASSWKATLIERDQEVQLWATGDSFYDLVQVLEAELVSSQPDWRKATAGRGKRR